MLVNRSAPAKVGLGSVTCLSEISKWPIYNVMRLSTSIWLGLTATICSTPVAAQRPGAIEVSALGVWHNKTTTMDGLRSFGAGARVGIWLPANFEVEGQFDFTNPRNASIDNRFQLFHLAGSLLYNIPIGGGTGYVRGGFGKLVQKNCVFNAIPCSSHSALTAAGGFRVPVSGGVSVRAEAMVRNRSAYSYTSFGGSLGISVMGGRSAGGVDADDDQDGVGNRRDRCRETPRGALVDDRGCPTDQDGDGVFDGIDRCPGTPSGTTVDAVGCAARSED